MCSSLNLPRNSLLWRERTMEKRELAVVLEVSRGFGDRHPLLYL